MSSVVHRVENYFEGRHKGEGPVNLPGRGAGAAPLLRIRDRGGEGDPEAVVRGGPEAHDPIPQHPYSEFIQDYVVAQCGLLPGGKLRDDFRLTEWGKLMRRLWPDELPMLYNWIRGDLQLFGVRPLSAQYFNMYPRELQVLRMQVKPGLMPPFYADMPETFEEICDSERRYIKAYLKRPVRTQVGYFWRAFYNIVFKGARSK